MNSPPSSDKSHWHIQESEELPQSTMAPGSSESLGLSAFVRSMVKSITGLGITLASKLDTVNLKARSTGKLQRQMQQQPREAAKPVRHVFPHGQISIPCWVASYCSTVVLQVLATSGCNSVNHVNQSESRIQILLQFDWMAQFSLLQPDQDLGKLLYACKLQWFSKFLQHPVARARTVPFNQIAEGFEFCSLIGSHG